MNPERQVVLGAKRDEEFLIWDLGFGIWDLGFTDH